MLGVVLGGVEVDIHLQLAAELHQGGPVLYGPGVAIVALDEAAEGHVGVVLHGEVLDLAVLHLLEDALHGGQAVERRVGVLAHHGDAAGVNGELVGVIFVKEVGGGSGHAVSGRLNGDVETNGAAGALNETHPRLLEGLHGAVLGVLVDPRAVGHLHGGGQRYSACAVCNAVGSGVDLILPSLGKGVGSRVLRGKLACGGQVAVLPRGRRVDSDGVVLVERPAGVDRQRGSGYAEQHSQT